MDVLIGASSLSREFYFVFLKLKIILDGPNLAPHQYHEIVNLFSKEKSCRWSPSLTAAVITSHLTAGGQAVAWYRKLDRSHLIMI